MLKTCLCSSKYVIIVMINGFAVFFHINCVKIRQILQNMIVRMANDKKKHGGHHIFVRTNSSQIFAQI